MNSAGCVLPEDMHAQCECRIVESSEGLCCILGTPCCDMDYVVLNVVAGKMRLGCMARDFAIIAPLRMQCNGSFIQAT